MFEELFKDSEEFASTDHPKILRAKKATESNPLFYHQLNELQEAALAHSNEIIPTLLAKLLPEFNHAPNKYKKTLNADTL
jgi:FlaA1/EpsC-like NDP-sugar epimerase